MEPIDNDTDAESAEEGGGEGLQKVEGRDPETVRQKREFEAEVNKKVASDNVHIIWAYGIIWVIFAIYGALLWRRAAAMRADLEALRKQNESK